MALTSQNGWAVSPPLDNRVVPGSDGVRLAPGVRSGDVATVLFYVAARLNLVVEKGHPGWCWGYAYRAIRGATQISNHASGTGFDWNAPVHPLGKQGSWSIAQRAIMQAITRDCRFLIRFGEFYSGRIDGMHCEVLGDAPAIAALAHDISAGRLPGGPDGTNGNKVASDVPVAAIVPPPLVIAKPAAPPKVIEPGTPAPGFPLRSDQYFGPRDPLTNKNSISGFFSHAGDLHAWQARMAYRGWKITQDGRYGDETENVAQGFQRDKSIAADGLIGPDTWRLAWEAEITR